MTLEKWFLLPVVLHFFITLLIGVRMGRARFMAARAGHVTRAEILNNAQAWPPDVLKLSNNFNNQFQLPMMWYGLTAFVLVTHTADMALLVLSWAFLAARIWHTLVHMGSNTLPLRFYAYLAGFGVLMTMWAWFAFRYFMVS
jgi:hypothetical protein